MSTDGAAPLADDCYNEEVIIDIEAIAAASVCDDEIIIDIEAIAEQTRLEEMKLKFDYGIDLFKTDVREYSKIKDEIALLIADYFKKSASTCNDPLKVLKIFILGTDEYQNHEKLSPREHYFSRCMLKYYMNKYLERFRSRLHDHPPIADQSASPSFITRTFEWVRKTTTTSYYSSVETSEPPQDSTNKKKPRLG